MKKNGGLLIGIIILGGFLRLLFINTRNIQYDDMFSYFLSRQSLGEIIKGTAADTMPPLYYFLLHYWGLISQEIWFLRLLSVLLSCGVMVTLFFLIRKLFGFTAGLWATFFAAISPLQIYHAQDIRMYALLAFLEVLFYYFVILAYTTEISDRQRLGYWLGAILSGAAAMYTHNLAIFGIVAPNLYLLIKRDWKKLRSLLFVQFMIMLVSIPWLVMLPGQIQKVQNAFWTPRPGIVEIFQSIIQLTSNLPISPTWLLMVASVISAQVFLLVYYLAWKNKVDNENVKLLVILSLLPPALIFVFSYLIRPIFVTRVFIYSATVFLGLAGVATAINWKKKIGVMLAILVIVNSVIALPGLYLYDGFPRSPYKAAADHLKSEGMRNLSVIHDNKLSYFPMRYYLPEANQRFLADEPGSSNDTFALASQTAMGIFPEANIEKAVDNSNGIVFIVFTKAISEYVQNGFENHPVLTWLGKHFTLVDKVVFGDLEMYYYVR